MVIHAGVGAAREGENAGAELSGEPAGGGAAAVAMGEGRWPVVPQAFAEAPEVTRREA